jgi:predicted MFS family arabinose efflux permease
VASLLGPYRQVLDTPGAPSFVAAAAVARVPIAMLGIGLVLLVSGSRGSYGQAGAVAAASLVAGSLAAPLQARLADRLGQPQVIAPLLVVHAAAVVAAVVAVESGASLLVVALAAAVAGTTLPQFGAFVRARWSARLAGTPGLPTAFALESVLDEVVFVVGPVLVTVVATQVSPDVAVLGTLLFTCGGGVAYLLCRSTVPPRHVREPGVRREPLPRRTLLPLVVAFVAMGATFGAIEVSTVAFADERGRIAGAGAVLAAFAAGSMLAGLAFGALVTSGPTRRRFVLGQAVFALALVPTVLVASLPALAVVLAIAGLAISPTLITGFGLAESSSPRSRVTEALAWVNTALGIGVAIGAAVAGPIIDGTGASAAYGVAVAGGLLAALSAVLVPSQRAASRL